MDAIFIPLLNAPPTNQATHPWIAYSIDDAAIKSFQDTKTIENSIWFKKMFVHKDDASKSYEKGALGELSKTQYVQYIYINSVSIQYQFVINIIITL